MAKRAGKYAAVVGTLPRLDAVEPERRDLVERVKEEVLAPLGSEIDEVLVKSLDGMINDEQIEIHVKNLIRLIKRSTAGRRWASEFARAYADARDLRDKIDEWRSSVNMLCEVFQELMVDQMEAEGISSMKLDNGRPISTYQEPYAQVADREAFRRYCEADPDLRSKMALPWSTTNSLVKELLLAGEPEPPGVTCFAKTVVRLGSD